MTHINKSLFLASGLIIFGLTAPAPAAITVVDTDWTVNTAIPQGNPVGITTSQTFAGLPDGAIDSVSVDLKINGGYNGGLYGYLVLQDANGNVGTEILLNQIGTSPSNPFGSPGSGFNITLSDSGTLNGSIHNAAGVSTGAWLPDSASTLNGTFGGLTANGTWTLFLADMINGGGTSTLESWGLNIAVVPEPATSGLLFAVAALLGMALQIRPRRS